MKTIVTGSAAFSGSHLCDLLLERGHEVICTQNPSILKIRSITYSTLQGRRGRVFCQRIFNTYGTRMRINEGVYLSLCTVTPASISIKTAPSPTVFCMCACCSRERRCSSLCSQHGFGNAIREGSGTHLET
ncbi:MAG: NAD-dependent epimerase/dehydratase family protein [Methanobacteriota archaeon]